MRRLHLLPAVLLQLLPQPCRCQARIMLARQLKMLMITKQAVTEASCALLKHKLARIPSICCRGLQALCEIPVDAEQAGDKQGAVAKVPTRRSSAAYQTSCVQLTCLRYAAGP